MTFEAAMKDLLHPPKGKVIYSQKMAVLLARRGLETIKKAPDVAAKLAWGLKDVPKLEAMVVKEVQLRGGSR